jgi:hypothetical protein
MKPVAKSLHANHMERLGIARTMRLSRVYNGLHGWQIDQYRRAQYRHNFSELLRENGAPTTPPIKLKDGYAIDTSMSLPHLDRLLEESAEIIRERGGVRRSKSGAYRSYFQNLLEEGDTEKYPSLLDFATSSDVVSVVANYLRCVPVMSSTLPVGIRFVESSAEYDDQPDSPHDSQLYHMDYYSYPNVYMLVLLEDVTPDKGPFCFLPASVSRKVAAKLNNWAPGKGYRFTDEEVYSVAKPSDVIEFAYPRGTVLFINPSACFHFGSRNCIKPRYQLMYGYTGACRTDMSEVFMEPLLYPVKDNDSRLRKMLLRKEFKS